jgi:FkbM family methyltransferase
MERDIPVPEAGGVVRARRVALPVDGDRSVELWIDRDEKDPITTSLLRGDFEPPPHYRLAMEMTSSASRVLDLGAHLGTFALPCAAAGCDVLAVEASPRNAALLRASAESNGFERLRVRWAAAAAAPGVVLFRVAGPYGLVAANDPAGIHVPAISAASELQALGWSSVDFVKLDVEGSEVAALRGLAPFLQSDDAPIIAYESNGYTLEVQGESPTTLARWLEAAGYRSFQIRPGRLIPTSSERVQVECNVDCVATKRPARLTAGWRHEPPPTDTVRGALAVASARHAHPHVRAYVARALAQDELASRFDVGCALDVLADDSEPAVRLAAAWWNEREPEA